MELFKAGNESQLKTIYKWIDESDVYVDETKTCNFLFMATAPL